MNFSIIAGKVSTNSIPSGFNRIIQPLLLGDIFHSDTFTLIMRFVIPTRIRVFPYSGFQITCTK
jgi:hypothetical protein